MSFAINPVQFAKSSSVVPVKDVEQDLADDEKTFAFLKRAFRIKSMPRKGWTIRGVDHPESIASHTWGVATMVMTFLPEHLNLKKALVYATLHDIAESITGDITPLDGVTKNEKYFRERQAINDLCQSHPKLKQYWIEYEDQLTPEAQYVKQLDRLETIMQCQVYSQQGVNALDIVDDYLEKLSDKRIKSLAVLIRKKIVAELEHQSAKRKV